MVLLVFQTVSIPEKWGILLKRMVKIIDNVVTIPVSIPEKWGILLKRNAELAAELKAKFQSPRSGEYCLSKQEPKKGKGK